MSTSNQDLQRYDDHTRMNHWAIALLFFLAALSGLAFFHPSLFFFTNLFGGGTWTRILHPYFGLFMVIAFAYMARDLWKQNIVSESDKQWLKKAGDMLKGDKSNMPPAGKYNAGQKVVFWLMLGSLATLLVTGLLFWQAWFGRLPVFLMRIGVLLHAVAAVVLVLSVIAHIYAAIWVKGTTRAMTKGTVTPGWAKANHPLWYEEMTKK